MSNMNTYTIRVRVGAAWTEVTVQAISPGMARQIVEAQYGAGSFLGYV